MELESYNKLRAEISKRENIIVKMNDDIRPVSKRECSKLSDFKSVALPLTLIAFRGGDAVSGLIRLIEKLQTGSGEFSHVGLLINSEICPFIPGLKPDKIYIWESTMSSKIFGLGGDGVADASTKETRFGVQIRDLEELLPKYLEVDGTAVAYCNLLNNPWKRTESREKIKKDMEALYKKYHDKLYEFNFMQLCGAGFPCFRRGQHGFGEKIVSGIKHIYKMPELHGDDDDFVFCSEFVAIVYQALGIIGPEFKPHDVVPTDFFGADIDGIPKIVNDPVYLEP